jgi:hypothetical protein
VVTTLHNMNVSRWAIGAAGVILVGTACLHAIGYRPLIEQLVASRIHPPWLAGVKGLWLVFSFHLIILGALFLAAAIRPSWVAKPVLLIAGLVPATDTVVLFAFVGVFVGTVLLGLAALLVYVGVTLWPSPGAGSR